MTETLIAAPTEPTTDTALFELLTLECRVDSDGSSRYYDALGQLHRLYGPAVEYSDGSKLWYQNGQRHRLDGPAVERDDGYRAWYQNGRLHSLDGPAAEWANGSKFWAINDKALTEAEWQRAVASMGNV